MTRRHDDDRIIAEAAQWLMELETEGAACHASFARWLRRSPEHIQGFLAVSGLSLKLDGIDRERSIDINELLAQTPDNIVELPNAGAVRTTRSRSAGGGRSKYALVLATAACAVFAVLFTVRWSGFGGETYETRLGEQRTVRLDDGSLISLNTQSRIEVRFSEETRDVRLLEGEALFSVEHDASRPFRVISGSTTVQAIGTQFNVYRSPAGTKVFVVEGVVQVTTDDGASGTAITPVTAKRLAAGEQVEVHRGQLDQTEPADANSAIAWRERQLVFRDKPLGEVAIEFNRYNAIKFEILGEVAVEPLSGVFAADRPESLALFLAKDPALRVDREDGRFIVRPRTPADRR